MLQRLLDTWLPALLFMGTLLLAAALALLVLLSPWLLSDNPQSRLLQVFARDGTVRRTSLASSLGLAVTAWVFFRPGFLRGKKSRGRRPPPTTFAGA